MEGFRAGIEYSDFTLRSEAIQRAFPIVQRYGVELCRQVRRISRRSRRPICADDFISDHV